MNRKVNCALSLIAGLLGGMVSHYLSPELVHAQVRTAPPKEISAQRFVLANEQGATSGVFGFDQNGNPSITLFDAQGHIVWSTKVRLQTIH